MMMQMVVVTMKKVKIKVIAKMLKLKSQENNPTMSSDMYIKTLNLLLMQSVNSVHIEFAMAEIARLKEEG